MESSGKIRTKLTLSFMDIFIGCLIILFSGFWLTMQSPSVKNKKKIVVYKDEVRLQEITLNKDRIISLEPHGVHMVMEIFNQTVRISSSDCLQQICVRKGWTGLVHDPIICMPNHITVIIEGDDPGYDAITH